MNLLLIDENQDNLDCLEEILETSGHKCDKYRFLEDAIPSLKKSKHDAAIASLCNYGVTSLNIIDDLQGINPNIKLILLKDSNDHNIAKKAVIKGAYTKYPVIVRPWRSNFGEIATLLNSPTETRKIIHTTKFSESYYLQLRKVTKDKRIFPTEEALFKMPYLVAQDVLRKWTGRIHNWGQILFQLPIFFAEKGKSHLR